MIRITLFLMLGLLVSCRSANRTSDAVEPPKSHETYKTHGNSRTEEVRVEEPRTPVTDTVTRPYYLGVVTELDCGYVINVIVSEDMNLYVNPTNLDPNFYVDGLRLKVKYRKGERTTWGCVKYFEVEILDAFIVR